MLVRSYGNFSMINGRKLKSYLLKIQPVGTSDISEDCQQTEEIAPSFHIQVTNLSYVRYIHPSTTAFDHRSQESLFVDRTGLDNRSHPN